MKAIRTRYAGPANTRGSRIIATAEGGPRPHRIVVPYDHGSDNPHADAAAALCRSLGWSGTLVEGGLPDGSFAFVFVNGSETVTVPS